MGLPDVLQDPFTAQFLAIAAVVLALVVWHFFGHRGPENHPSAPSGNQSSSCSRAQPSEPARPAAVGTGPLPVAAHGLFSAYPTMSLCCNSLFSEPDAEVLSEGISMLSDTVVLLREAANVSKVYLIYQDRSPEGMLGVILTSALEAEGLLGSEKGQVPKHRLVCCGTEVGKIAVVRQLETALHIESNNHVHKELSRFKTVQWLVGRPNGADGLVAVVRRKCGL